MKTNDSNGPNATDRNKELLQHQPRNGECEEARPGLNTIYAEWQNGLETFSGHAQKKVHLAFVTSPGPTLIEHKN